MDNIEFLLVRTTSTIGSVAGSFDITLSTDEYELDYDIDIGEGIFPEIDVTDVAQNDWPLWTTGLYSQTDIGWSFGDDAGADPERRLLTSTLLAGDIDEEGDELVVGVVKLSEEGNRYKIIALSGTVPTDDIFTFNGGGDDDDNGNPFSEVLGVWYTDTLEGEYNFTKNRDSDEYLYIIIQNWSTNSLRLDNEKPETQFISDNFDRWLGPEGGEPQLALIGNPDPDNIKEFGAGVSVLITPYDYGDDQATDPGPANGTQYTISELDGTFSLYVDEEVENSIPDDDDFETVEYEMQFTWDEGSGGGCSALGFIPGSLLILLPLFLLFKKR